MTDYYLIYRDIEDYPDQIKTVILAPPTDDAFVQNGILPGLHGMKPIYIRWWERSIGKDTFNIVTYTHHDMKTRELKSILKKAFKLAKKDGAKLGYN